MASGIVEVSGWKLGGRWTEFAIKAVVLVLVFGLIAWLGPIMPPVCLAILWALLSIASAVGVAYHCVVSKVRNRAGLEDGGIVARFNSGRIISLTVAFLLSAGCVGSLLLELPKWEAPEWVMLVLSIPLFIGI